MQRLKALGAPIDGVAIDNETTLHAANFLGTPGSLAAIEQDPRWPSLAASMGLPVRVSDMSWGSPSYYLLRVIEQSIMCSSTFGPASVPSLVTWPTSTSTVPVCLAKRVR